MIVQCGHCGAPLDVTGEETVVRCHYCGTKNERQRARTIYEQTPPDFAPPKKWVPPAEFPADSNQELEYRGGGSKIGCVLGLGIPAVASLVVGIAWCHDQTGFFGNEPANLATLSSLDGTADSLHATLSGDEPDEKTLWSPVHSGQYRLASFSWDEKQLDHPRSFYLVTRDDDSKPDAEARKRLSAALRGGLDKDGSWRWEGISINFDDKKGGIGASAGPDENALWKRQLDAAWKIVIAAAFDLKVAPSHAEMVELMGAGYPLADLAKISPTTITVDHATDVVRRAFPGAAFESSGEIVATVAVDHPVIRDVRMRWRNERAGTMRNADFRPVGGSEALPPARVESFAACLSKTFGAARVTDTDYMKKTKSYSWSDGGASINVQEYGMSVSMYEKADAATWQRVVGALDGCR